MYFAGLDTHESRWEGVSGCGSGSEVGLEEDPLVKNDVMDLTEPDLFLPPPRSFDFALPVGAGGLDPLVGAAADVTAAGVVCVLEVAGRPLSLPLSLCWC